MFDLFENSWTIGAAVAHFLDMEGVTGSIPVSSTNALVSRLKGES